LILRNFHVAVFSIVNTRESLPPSDPSALLGPHQRYGEETKALRSPER
jgi:hypothetical protein